MGLFSRLTSLRCSGDRIILTRLAEHARRVCWPLMEFRHLRYFVAVAEEESVTRAAKKLHVTQPTLSRQINDLESELAVALFDHGARTIALTGVGRVFLEEARAVLQRGDLAVQMIRAVAGGKRGAINVGYAPSPTVELLPQILRLFQQSHPDVRVQLHDTSGAETIAGLNSGSLDLALTVQGLQKTMAGLTFEELRRYAVCVAVPAGHRLASARKVALKQLLGEQLIAYSRADYHDYHAMIRQLFAPLKRQPELAEEHDSATSLIASVGAGRGVAIVTETFATFAGSQVKIIPLVPAPPPVAVGVAYRKTKLSAAAKNFIVAAKQGASIAITA